MDFSWPESTELWRQDVAQFAKETLAPDAGRREAQHAIPHDVMRSLASHGLLGVNIPKAWGGAERGVVAYALALREVAGADASVAVTMAVTNMVAEVITRFGSDAMRRKYVPALVSGEFFGGAFGLSEPGAGSDAGALTTRAESDGTGFRLSGQKLWISTGDQAGVIVIWARTGGPGPKGISCFLVDGNAPGLTAGKPEHKMGLRASHTVALDLQDVKVGGDHQLGELNNGFSIAMMALDGGRIGISAQALGLAEAGMRETQAYLMRTENKARRDAQHVQFKLADMRCEIDAAWLMTLRAAWLKQQGRSFSREAAMTKVLSTETANRVLRQAIDICGEEACRQGSTLERLFRDCRVTQIYEGTSEIQRVVIARDLLR